MKNEDIYLDITNDKLHHVNVLFGGRGIGKTYSILKYRVMEAHNDESNMSKFIWLRDSDVVVKKIAAGNSLTSPIERNIPDFPHIEFRKKEGNQYECSKTRSGNPDQRRPLGGDSGGSSVRLHHAGNQGYQSGGVAGGLYAADRGLRLHGSHVSRRRSDCYSQVRPGEAGGGRYHYLPYHH